MGGSLPGLMCKPLLFYMDSWIDRWGRDVGDAFDLLVDLGVDTLITGVGDKVSEGDIDRLAEVSDLGHREGLKVMVAVNCARNRAVALDRSEWAQRYDDGVKSGWGAVCLNSGYRVERVQEIVDLVAECGLDGVWVDTAAFFPIRRRLMCFCDSCRSEFEDRYGTGMPEPGGDWSQETWRRFIDFHYWTVKNFLDYLSGRVREVNPRAVLSLNYYPWHSWLYGHDLASVPGAVDIVSSESFYKAWGEPLQGQSEAGAWLRAINGGDLVWIEIQAHHAEYWFAPISPLELKVQAYQVIASHAVPMLWCYPRVMDRASPTFRAMKHVLSCYDRVRPFYDRSFPLRYVGVVYSQRSRDLAGKMYPETHVDDVRGFFHALLSSHIPVEYLVDSDLEDYDKLSRFSSIVLPSVYCLTETAAENVARFVEDGGGLVGTYLTSAADKMGVWKKSFSLGDVLGVELEFPTVSLTPRCDVELESHDITRGIYEQPLSYFGPQALTRSRGQGTVATAIRTDDPESITSSDPLFIAAGSHGKGRVVYCSGQLGRVCWVDGLPHYNQLAVNSVLWAARNKPPLKVDAPSTVLTYPYTTGGKLLIHIVNLSTNQLFRCQGHPLTNRGIALGPFLLGRRGNVNQETAPLVDSTRTTNGTINEIIPVHNVEINIQTETNNPTIKPVISEKTQPNIDTEKGQLSIKYPTITEYVSTLIDTQTP